MAPSTLYLHSIEEQSASRRQVHYYPAVGSAAYTQ